VAISVVSLYLTEACNLRCRYCFLKKQPRRLPVDLGRQVVDFMLAGPPKVKQVSVYFFGGEPLIEFETIKELTLYGRSQAAQKGKKLRLGVTTNGTLMTDEILDFLFGHKISINLSLDGRPETQNMNRQTATGHGSFPLIDGVIDSLLARNPNQGARMTYDTKSVHTLYEDHEYLWSRGFKNTSPIAAFEDNWTEETLATAEEQYRLIAQAVLERMRAGDLRRVTFLTKYIGRIATLKRRIRIPCGVCAAYIGISVDGVIYPCQRFAADEACAFGTLHEVTDPEMRRKFLSFDPRHLEGCDECPARMYCAGGCPAISWLCGGDLYSPWPGQCGIIRREFKTALWLYRQLKKENNPLLAKIIQSSRYARNRRSLPACEPVGRGQHPAS